ncbi:MAG: radical SAM protein [Calditerrivibrio sp.]|nr:radical SAM protein [Calditerrivibrio sp.]
MKKAKILPVFIPFFGCRNRCLFCNQERISGVKIDDFEKTLIKQIEVYLEYEKDWDEIAFYGGSFTCMEKEHRYISYRLAHRYGFCNIRISTRPDCLGEEVLEELVLNKVKTVEMGVQSTSDKVLKANLRNYTKTDIITASKRVKERFTLGHQIMVGMFAESIDDFWTTVIDVCSMRPDFVRIYPTVVLKNSPLEEIYNQGAFCPYSPSITLALTSMAFVYFKGHHIEVIRVGLQDSSELKSAIVAGFYHSAMGELVKTVAMISFAEKYNVLPGFFNGYKNIIKKIFPKLEVVEDINWYSKFLGEDFEDNWRIFKRAADIVCERIWN